MICFVWFVQSHLAELDAADIPEEVVEHEDVVFSNIKEIYGFHTRYSFHAILSSNSLRLTSFNMPLLCCNRITYL